MPPKTKTTKTIKTIKKSEKDNSNDIRHFPSLSCKSSLRVTEVEPNQIYLIHDLFTSKECDALIKHFETHLPPQPVPTIPKRGEAFRSNDRQSLEDAAFAQQLWEIGLDKICGEQEGIGNVSLPRKPVGLNSNIRVYRYRVGQKFEGHYDDSVQDKTTGLWTHWTLLCYLNEDMEGGETVFYKHVSKKRKSGAISIRPEKGLALLHLHGNHCLFHEAMEVSKGAKWVLRSDVLVG
ncbi:hypothetical protein DFQ28_002201 [Apophysomyces sp. BC1034]|nr:hypothetical protein DFQ30_002733 [Apophysomyces sp. BC1015]KAG0179831.1 hypothetical protein DFQ29_001595 [Apophysomyces sp. BC1021]KAG0190316.1 hypothetical protein DFQ28_002201 [Apophysomyces sp. BC1034]